MTCRWPQVCQTRVAERFESRCTVLDDAFLLLRKTAQLHLWMYEVYRNTVLPSRQYNPIISNLYIYIYLDNPSVQNYRSKSETAIIIAGCLNFRCFQFFSPFQFPHFGLLIFVRPFVGFFRRFVGFFRRFKTGKHMQHEKHAKSVRRQKKMPSAIIPEKAIILHTLEDAGICIWNTLKKHWFSSASMHLAKQLLRASMCG